MRTVTGTSTSLRRAALLALLLGAAGASSPASAAPDPLRIAFVGPVTGPLAKATEESLMGIRAAVEAAAATRAVEVVPFDDAGDAKTAAGHVADARKLKFAAVIAVQTGLTVKAVAEEARQGRTPVLLVGSAPPAPSADPTDPVMFFGPNPVEQALTIAQFLAIHTEKSGLGTYRDCLEPAIVAEDTERGRELADALKRNLGPRQHLTSVVYVPPLGGPSRAQLQLRQKARCDRLVLFGEPDLIDRTQEAARSFGWSVPLFCADGMLSKASAAIHEGKVREANFVEAVPTRAQIKEELPEDTTIKVTPVSELENFWGKRFGSEARFYPRTRNAWLAAWMVVRAAEKARRPQGAELIAALRALAFTREEERERPYIDDMGYVALPQWFLWTMGEKAPERIKPGYLPTRDLGPLLRMKKPQDWDLVPVDEDTKVVWLTFSEKSPAVKSDPARTIEEDMGFLGLGTRGYEAELDPWLLDELMVRTLGKINRLFLKNYDGTFIPGVSFNIHFTFTKPEHLKPSRYWVGVIAGEESMGKDGVPTEGAPGGKVIGSGRVAIYSRWMRHWTAIKDKRLRPPMNREDKKYMDGTYSWGTAWEENLRSDSLRALVDGYASWFAMTGAHEFGHCCGCGHDTESSRSIMNVVDAVGLRDTQACWIPSHVKALETALGRKGAKSR